MGRTRTYLALAAIAAGALSLGACDSVLGTNGLAGSYELTRIAGRSLPYALDTYTASDGARCEVDVVAGSVTLDNGSYNSQYDNGEFELQLAYRETCRATNGQVFVNYPIEREDGSFEERTDRVYFYPYQHVYFSDFTGRVSGSSLTLEIGGRSFEFREDRTIG